MDRNFRLTETGRRRAKLAMLRKMLIPFVVFEVIVLGAVFLFVRLTTLQIVAVGMLALLMLQVFIIRTWRNPTIAFRDWGLHLGEDSVYLTENPQATEIKRGDIGFVAESSDGLVVKKRNSIQRMWIPAGVEDYPCVKRTLESWLQHQ